ncbi:MAG: hypothetical protein RR085_06910 [Clostridia bacterium]
MLLMNFGLKNETKTCYRFECREGEDFTTLYLKKAQVREAGIDPNRGITITIEEKKI